MHRVLFVGTANIFRSLTAEHAPITMLTSATDSAVPPFFFSKPAA